MELQINTEPGETGRSLKEVTGSNVACTHTCTHAGILNYHCILFLSDPIIPQPQNNYIQWMHSKTQMKCNKRSETLSARLSGLENGSLWNTPLLLPLITAGLRGRVASQSPGVLSCLCPGKLWSVVTPCFDFPAAALRLFPPSSSGACVYDEIA